MIDQILAAGKLVQGKSFMVQENERPVSRTQGNKQCGKDQATLAKVRKELRGHCRITASRNKQ
jgi:hypothetical protein